MGSDWVHLRMCLKCGNVACCDSSNNQHARKHFDVTNHPLIRSIEPHNDNWSASEQAEMGQETFVACFVDTQDDMDISQMPKTSAPKHHKVASSHSH
jgi:hypothetical protein